MIPKRDRWEMIDDPDIVILPNPNAGGKTHVDPDLDPDSRLVRERMNERMGYDTSKMIGIGEVDDLDAWLEVLHRCPHVLHEDIYTWYGRISLKEFKAMNGVK